MTLRLRCIRCGNWGEMDPFWCAGAGLCAQCYNKAPAWGGMPWWRWARWQKNMERHPTFIALQTELDRMERVKPGVVDVETEVVW